MKAKRLTRGGYMRRARREKGLTMVDLGEKSGVCVCRLARALGARYVLTGTRIP